MNEPVRILRAWYADAAYGIAPVWAAIPRDVGDPAPEAITLADETADDWVAQMTIPVDVGKDQVVVAVSLEDDINFEGNAERTAEGGLVQSAPVIFVVEVFSRRSSSASAGTEFRSLLRAIHGSTRLLFDGPFAEQRQRNGVELVRLSTVTYLSGTTPLDDNLVECGLRIEAQLRALVPDYTA